MDDENKYNDALEKLQEALAPKDGCEISGLTRACIEEIFPELKESEDERIKRNIIAALKGEGYYDCDLTNECIAWLEKQGEKPQGKSALEASKEKKIDNANKVEQSSAWSEEDDYNVQCLVAKVTSDIQNGNVGRNQELIDWLKSIKDRVQPQNLWKPSDEQIKALEYFIRGIGESGHVSPYDANLKLVHSLLNNLKKLK